KERKVQNIRSLYEAFKQATQVEREQIAKIKVIPQVDEQRIPQIVLNIKIGKQNKF
ncbi:268_t:CDS:1, partial [Scutellospora calospora]